MTRYKATRSLHYIAEDGTEQFVAEGDEVTGASEGKIAALLADGFVEATKAAPKSKDGE